MRFIPALFSLRNVVAACAAILTTEAAAGETSALQPYTGPSERGVDVSTLTGKLMCGYQGWFNAEGDGAKLGFRHWTRRRDLPAPANANIDLWPDVSELAKDERFQTGFHLADGR